MFSKWRRKEEPQPPARSPSVGQISEAARRKFARGVDCNVKVIIRGDTNTGKSSLFARLQNLPFPAEHVNTPQIQVANISWKYKVTSDVVKVEVWDIVDHGTPVPSPSDKGRAPATKGRPASKSDPPPPENTGVCLDASFVDVYKGTNGVIFVFDITKKWTLKYIEQELPKVPSHIPVLVLGNFRDKAAARAVDADEARYIIEGLNRNAEAGNISYAEASMANDFGLHYVNRFLNLPYLHVQKRHLEDQLKKNRLEIDAAVQEMELFGPGSKEQDFDQFIQHRQERTAQQAQQQAQAQTQAQALAEAEQQARRNSSVGDGESRFAKLKAAAAARLKGKPASAGTTPLSSPRSLSPAPASLAVSGQQGQPVNVDTFVPDEKLDDDFFSDAKTPKASAPGTAQQSEDDSDEDDNPLVAADASDLEDDLLVASSDDEVAQAQKEQAKKMQQKKPTKKAAAKKPAKKAAASSDEDSDDEDAPNPLVAGDKGGVSDSDSDSDSGPNPMVAGDKHEVSSDDDRGRDSDADDEPVVASKSSSKKPASTKPASTKPASTKPAAKASAPAIVVQRPDDDDDDDDDDDEPNPLVGGVGGSSDDSDEDDFPPKKATSKSSKPKGKGKSSKAQDDDPFGGSSIDWDAFDSALSPSSSTDPAPQLATSAPSALSASSTAAAAAAAADDKAKKKKKKKDKGEDDEGAEGDKAKKKKKHKSSHRHEHSHSDGGDDGFVMLDDGDNDDKPKKKKKKKKSAD